MFNRFATGDMLRTDTRSVSTADLPKFQRRNETPGAPRAAVFATRKFVINEKTGGTAKGLPPAEVYLYVFEDTDIPAVAPAVSTEEVLKQPVNFVAAP